MGDYDGEGNWVPAEGSPFRRLTAEEVADTRAMAEATTPSFDGPNNASWAEQHPVAREVWTTRGLAP